MLETSKAKKKSADASTKKLKQQIEVEPTQTKNSNEASGKNRKKKNDSKTVKMKAAGPSASKGQDNNSPQEFSNQTQPIENDYEAQELSLLEKPSETLEAITLKISNSLHRKLISQAEDEGISLDDYLRELLSESVVLRAWEIVERKNQMRGTAPVNPIAGNGRNQQNHRNHNHRKHRGGMSQGRYQSIMEDKATFLEYVRNQERNRR